MHACVYVCVCVCVCVCTWRQQVCITIIKMFAANAGCRVVHRTPADDNQRMEQNFITHVIFAEMSLLSSIICSIGARNMPSGVRSYFLFLSVAPCHTTEFIIRVCSIPTPGCTTLVGMEILLINLFPDTFQHRIWTFRSCTNNLLKPWPDLACGPGIVFDRFYMDPCDVFVASSEYQNLPTHAADPLNHFLGYLTVVICNVIISIAVAWLLQRDFCALQGG